MSKKILVIDDDVYLRDLLGTVLAYGRYDVLCAATAEDGIRRAIEWLPDMIILDLLLGVDGGDRVYRELQGNPNTRGIPVVICTVQRAAALRRCFGERRLPTLFKPFLPKEVLETAEAVLGGRPIHAAPRSGGTWA